MWDVCGGCWISDGDDDGDDGWVPWVVEVVVGKRSFRCEGIVG